MSRVIFLDVDGVLNCYTTEDKCCGYLGIEDQKVAILKDIVDLTGADIVLTSTWRHEREKGTKMGEYLDEKLAKYGLKIADQTKNISWSQRNKEILMWLSDHPEVDWFVILDDEDFNYEQLGWRKHWICTQDVNFWWELYPGLMPHNVDFIRDNMDQFSFEGVQDEG